VNSQTTRTKYNWRGAVQTSGIIALVLGVILSLYVYLSGPESDPMGIYQSITRPSNVNAGSQTRLVLPPSNLVYLPLIRHAVPYELTVVAQTEAFQRPDNNTPSISAPTLDGQLAFTTRTTTDTVTYQSFVLRQDHRTKLPIPFGFSGSTTTALNTKGQVVGYLTKQEVAGPREEAVVWEADGQVHILEPLAGSLTRAYDINTSGTVVGHSSFAAALWRNDHIQQLTMSPAYASSAAYAINDNGQSAGSVTQMKPSADRAAWWDATGMMHILGAGGEIQSGATDINDHTTIIGWSGTSTDPYGQHAVVWQNGGMSLLPGATDTTSRAVKINNTGQVIGILAGRAVLWPTTTTNAQAFDDLLGSQAEWHIVSTLGINDAGQVTALAQRRGTDIYSLVILNPT
jgi:probable HAF family extracellular repeat protein